METIKGKKITYRYGTRDEEILQTVLKDNLYRFPDILSGTTVVDIGAHIGAAAMAAASRGAKVYAIEPVKDNFALLRENTKDLNVSCFNVAIGKPGKKNIYMDPENTGCNYLLYDETLSKFKNEEVEVISLPDFFTQNNIDACEVLKMDCEGAEIDIIPQILDGLFAKIKTIVGELHWELKTTEVPNYGRQLKEHVKHLEQYYTFQKINKYEFVCRRK